MILLNHMELDDNELAKWSVGKKRIMITNMKKKKNPNPGLI